MARIKGITITLYKRERYGTDPFGRPEYKEIPIRVKNVLVSPTSSDDVVNTLNLTGKRAVYTLAIPKGDTNEWEDRRVQFFGENWRVFGFVTEGIEEMIPLEWNKKVMVERYE